MRTLVVLKRHGVQVHRILDTDKALDELARSVEVVSKKCETPGCDGVREHVRRHKYAAHYCKSCLEEMRR